MGALQGKIPTVVGLEKEECRHEDCNEINNIHARKTYVAAGIDVIAVTIQGQLQELLFI